MALPFTTSTRVSRPSNSWSSDDSSQDRSSEATSIMPTDFATLLHHDYPASQALKVGDNDFGDLFYTHMPQLATLYAPAPSICFVRARQLDLSSTTMAAPLTERRFSQHYLIAFHDKAVDITALPASTTPEAQSWRRQSLAVLRIGLSQPPNLRCLEIGQPYPDFHRRHGHRLQSLHCQVWGNDDVKVLSKSLAHRRHPLLKRPI